MVIVNVDSAILTEGAENAGHENVRRKSRPVMLNDHII